MRGKTTTARCFAGDGSDECDDRIMNTNWGIMKTCRQTGDRDANKGEYGLDLRGSATRSRWLGRTSRLTAQQRPFQRPPQLVHFNIPSPASPHFLEMTSCYLVLAIHSSVTSRSSPPLFSVFSSSEVPCGCQRNILLFITPALSSISQLARSDKRHHGR